MLGASLLEADLQMKKTVAALIHPDTALGGQFWAQLGDSDESCLSMRQWIVPAPATVREDGNALYIIDAPLNVKMESDYVKNVGGVLDSCPQQSKSIQDHNEAVFRSLILPQIVKAVTRRRSTPICVAYT